MKKAKPVNPEILLNTWAELNDGLKDCTEEQCKTLLDLERASLKRTQFLLRIYGRYNTLRTQRERKELMAE